MGASTWGYHSFVICPGTLQTAQTTLSAKNTTTLFALTLTAKTGLSLLMITQQRPKLPALDLEVVTSTNSLITLKDKMVDTDFAELKLVMRKADVLNFSLPLWSQNLDQTNSQLWLKETRVSTKPLLKKSSEISTLNSLSPLKVIWMLKPSSVPSSRLEVPTTWDNKLKFYH